MGGKKKNLLNNRKAQRKGCHDVKKETLIVKNWEDDFNSLKERLELCNLTISSVPKDGNCLFRSVADQLSNLNCTNCESLDHMVLRHNTVKFLQNNKSTYEGFIEDNIPFETYCLTLGEWGTWGGQLELQILSLIYKVNIVIYQEGSITWVVKNFHSGNTPCLQLSYHNYDHFNSVKFNNYDHPLQSSPHLITLDIISTFSCYTPIYYPPIEAETTDTDDITVSTNFSHHIEMRDKQIIPTTVSVSKHVFPINITVTHSDDTYKGSHSSILSKPFPEETSFIKKIRSASCPPTFHYNLAYDTIKTKQINHLCPRSSRQHKALALKEKRLKREERRFKKKPIDQGMIRKTLESSNHFFNDDKINYCKHIRTYSLPSLSYLHCILCLPILCFNESFVQINSLLNLKYNKKESDTLSQY